MTTHEVYKVLNKKCDLQERDVREALSMAIEALKKQVPRMPEMVKPGIGKRECGSLIEKPKNRKPMQYCKWCGQAVDWGVDNGNA